MVLLLAACRPAAPLPAAPNVLDVTMAEYRFQHAPTVSGGRVVFRVRNTGKLPHQLVLIQTPKQTPGGRTSKPGGVQAAVPLAITPDQGPGDAISFAQDLGPGEYRLMCLLTDPGGKQHLREGMRSDLRVQ